MAFGLEVRNADSSLKLSSEDYAYRAKGIAQTYISESTFVGKYGTVLMRLPEGATRSNIRFEHRFSRTVAFNSGSYFDMTWGNGVPTPACLGPDGRYATAWSSLNEYDIVVINGYDYLVSSPKVMAYQNSGGVDYSMMGKDAVLGDGTGINAIPASTSDGRWEFRLSVVLS